MSERTQSREGATPVVEVHWLPENAVGVREIDDDHVQLFALANEVFRATTRDDADFRPIALRLFSYARTHFTREEALMASIGYPDLAKHRRRHDRFTEMLGRIMDPAVRPEEVGEKLRLFMLEWVLRHILSEDLRIAKHMADTARPSDSAKSSGG